jgi:dTMP kinase
MRGYFITFEGVEGCGKTTQIQRLHSYLVARGHAVTITREPGGVPIAEAIRAVLLDPATTTMGPVTELLLYEAARAQHVHELILPALQSGKIVLCDRFADSTTAYQGAGRSLPMIDVLRLHRIATQEIWPHLTLLIDLPVEMGMDRVRLRGLCDRIEQESLAFHDRVRQGFLRLAQEEPERIKIVDGTLSVDDVFAAVRKHVDALLNL